VVGTITVLDLLSGRLGTHFEETHEEMERTSTFCAGNERASIAPEFSADRNMFAKNQLSHDRLSIAVRFLCTVLCNTSLQKEIHLSVAVNLVNP
jgi:hypothetical protein